MPQITFVREGKKIEVEEGANLRQAAMDAGISVYQGVNKLLNCYGFGLCGTCLVYVKEGQENCSEKGWIESLNLNGHPLTLMHSIGHEDEARLSCQMQVYDDVVVDTNPQVNLHGIEHAYERKLKGDTYVEFPDHAPRGVNEKKEREEKGVEKDWFHEKRRVKQKEHDVEAPADEDGAAPEDEEAGEEGDDPAASTE